MQVVAAAQVTAQAELQVSQKRQTAVEVTTTTTTITTHRHRQSARRSSGHSKHSKKDVFQGKLCGVRVVPAQPTYPTCKFSPQIQAAQKKLAGKLPAPKSDKCEAAERSAQLAAAVPDSCKELKDGLTNVKDDFDLVKLQPQLFEGYTKLASDESQSKVAKKVEKCLEFTTKFPPGKFSPRDCAIAAMTVAPKLKGEVGIQLVDIAACTTADFIDKELYTAIEGALRGCKHEEVQVVRWMYANVNETQIVEGDSPTPSIDRGVEVPELQDEKRKPQPVNNLPAVLKAARKFESKVEKDLEEKQGPKDVIDTLKGVGKELRDLEKKFADAKIIHHAKWFTEAKKSMMELESKVEEIDKGLKKYQTRLVEQLELLELYVSYLNRHERFCVHSVQHVLQDAKSELRHQSQGSSNPTLLSRNAILEASLSKLEASVMMPGMTEKAFEAMSPVLLELQQEVDSLEASNFIMIAEWIVRVQNLQSSPVSAQLHDTTEAMKKALMGLSLKKDELSDANKAELCAKWSTRLSEWIHKVDDLADGEPVSDENKAEQLTDLRCEFDEVLERGIDLGLDDELAPVATEMEAVISSASGKSYRHKPRKSIAREAPTGRVSFMPADIFKESANYDLLPQDIKHPVYESWDPSTFHEFARMNKSVPIDMEMLRKVTVSKLARRGQRIATKSESVAFMGFKIFYLKPSASAFKNKIPDEELGEKINHSIENLNIVERGLPTVSGEETPFMDKLEWLERSLPLLEDVVWQDHPEIAERYDTFIVKFNAFVDDLINGSVLPRPTVVACCERLKNLLALLATYKEMEAIQADEQSVKTIDRWSEYFREALRVMSIVEEADDELAIYFAKSFLSTFRGSVPPFAHPADMIDQKAGRKTMAMLAAATQKILDLLVQEFLPTVKSSDLCTVTDAQQQLASLRERFASSGVSADAKKLMEEIGEQVEKILAAPDVNVSTADDASQKLRAVHIALEPEVKACGDEAYQLFCETVGLRASLKNMHVSDAEVDQKLADLSSITISDFQRLIDHISSGLTADDEQKADFTAQWTRHLKLCQRDVECVHKASEMVSNSMTRYAVFVENMSDVYNSLTVLENKRFPLSVTPYNKLALHLDKLLEYCKVRPLTRDERRSDRKAAEGLALQMQFMTLSTFSTMAPVVDDSVYEKFADGFIKTDLQTLQSQIVDNVSQSATDKRSIYYVIASIFGDLFAAHAEAFTRNYNICSKSTRVCRELMVEFCRSIIECTDAGAKALKTQDATELKEAVASHVTAIQQIQNQFNDQSTYSDFGRQRLTIFAHFCCILAQETTLNIYELSVQNEPFDFDEIQVHVRQCLQIFQQLGNRFDVRQVFDKLQDTESIANVLDETNDRLVVFLQTESKFCEALYELVEKMMEEADLRFWQSRDVELKVSSPVIAKPAKDAKHVMAADLKRSIDIITENLLQFKTTLMAGEIDEATLLVQIDGLDDTTKLLCDTAVCVDADKGFYDLVQTFREQTVALVNFLRHELYVGTYVLYSNQVNELLSEVNRSSIQIIRQLGHMEQLEEDSPDVVSTILARLAKMLLLARDDLVHTAEKVGVESLTVLCKSTGASYETVANVLLTIKNANPKVIRMLQTERLSSLRHIIFATQTLLSAAGVLEGVIAGYGNDRTESPEFQFKSHFEPVLAAIMDLKRAIPQIVPNAGTLIQLIASVLAQLSIAIEPRYEERPMFAVEL